MDKKRLSLLKGELRTIQETFQNQELKWEEARELLDYFFAACFPLYHSLPYTCHPGRVSSFAKIHSEVIDGFFDRLQSLMQRLTSESRVPEVIEELPELVRTLVSDAECILNGDPAANTVGEVIAGYPGFFAIATYRFAHMLLKLGVPMLPRLLSEVAHARTGVDIHPSAKIARGCCIDHGTGIVIGATAILQENVKLYQGVTLGALSVEKGMASSQRHPIIERDVVIYSNATILGGDTVIGEGSIIGGNVWLTSSVPPRSRVYHRGEVVVRTQRSQEE